MKHIAFYLGIAAALVASCSIQEENFQTPVWKGDVFFASIEQPSSSGTKVYVDEDLKVLWDKDDLVSIFNLKDANDEYRYTGESFELVKPFSEEGVSIDHRYAVYPYSSATSIDMKGVLSVELPALQQYRAHSFGPGANLMTAVTDDMEFQFKNAGGYLLLKLYGEGVSVSSITLKGNKGEKIAGTASVTMPLNGLPSIEMASDATTEITLTCAEPVALGATVEESVDFWFVVPPVTFSEGFTVSVTHQGGVFEKTTGKSVTISRNHLSKMAPVDVNEKPATATTYRITNMWLWGGTGPEYDCTKVYDLLTKPGCFNDEDGRGITALQDNYYQLWSDGKFVNYAGEDARNWWFVYSGSQNPATGKDVDLRSFYDLLPLSEGRYAIDGATVTFTKSDGTTTSATFVGPGTYDMPGTTPTKTVTIERQALMFEIQGGKDNWDFPWQDYGVIACHPRVLFIEMEQMPADFVVPEASRTFDADFKFIPPEDPGPGDDFDWTTLPGSWNVYGGNSAPFGIWVLGGSGDDPAFVSPIDKSWDWDDTIWKESDNGLVIKVTSFSSTEAKGTTNWWAGNDGQFWDYIWKKTGEDLSRFYNKIPKGEKEFTLDLVTMTATLGNGEQAKFLLPGTHEFVYGKTREIPEGCFGLAFHLMDPIAPTADRWSDVDRFVNAPLEYVIIFEKEE